MAFRTKKISQMDPKGANLASTDLLEISELVSGSYVTKSITGAEIIASVPPSVTSWGTITGTLSAQTDLNTALSGKVPTTRTLTINGTTQDLSADRTFTISTGITIGTTAITSGTVGRVLFEGTGNVVQESANLFWDNTNGRLGIGTSSPTQPIEVVKNQNATTKINISNTTSGTSAASEISLTSNSGAYFSAGKLSPTYSAYKTLASSDGYLYNGTGGDISLLNDVALGKIKFTAGASTTAQMTLFSTGNVGINTTTDAGYKLDVNGTARVVNTLSVNTGNVSGQGVQMGSDSNMGIFNNGGIMQLRQYSNSFELAGGGTTVFLRTDGNRINTIANYGIALGTYGVTTANSSAILEAYSTTKGFLPPRMTTTQKNAIASPATGLMVYDTTLNLMSVYNGTTWITL